MIRARVFAVSLVAAAVATAAPRLARASEGSDGAYGRLDGDLELGAGAGIAFEDGGPSFTSALTATYLSTAGVALRYGDAFGKDTAVDARSFAVAVAFRPLFLGRFLKNMEQGPAALDLTLDSLTLDVGAFAREPANQPGDAREYDWGLETGLELAAPLTSRGTGLFLVARGALRFAENQSPAPGDALVDTRALFTLSLAFRGIVASHLVDAADRALR